MRRGMGSWWTLAPLSLGLEDLGLSGFYCVRVAPLLPLPPFVLSLKSKTAEQFRAGKAVNCTRCVL